MENPSAMPNPSATVGRRHLTWTLLKPHDNVLIFRASDLDA
jgi:hypothetical protein